jgi:peptidoglycan/xylan/chitin deacetylase (PgdA/CDA1 family)
MTAAPTPWRYRLAVPALFVHRLTAPRIEGFRILMFHDIPEQQTEIFRRFAEMIVATHGVLTPEEAETWLGGDRPAPSHAALQPCLFSFDDGFASNRRIAETVLAPLGIRALFFISPGLIELKPEEQAYRIAATVFDGKVEPEDIPASLRPMTWDELGELKAMGHAIGAHGMLHRRLTALAGEELEWEILESAARIESRLGAGVPWYAYAFGDIGSISRSALELIGQRYRFCRSGLRGANDADIDRLALRADMVDLDGPLAYQQLTVEGGLDRLYKEARQHLDLIVGPQPIIADSDDENF